MIKHRFFAMIASAFFMASSAIARAVERIAAFAFVLLAAPFRFPPSFGRVATAGGPAFAYDGPPLHQLRHEAGVSRRSAARNT